jgi:CRISPR-associated protein Cmr4
MTTRLLFVQALTPLHAGTGQGVGVIDLPIAREKATGLPYLPGSSVKGTLRDQCPAGQRERVFGPETNAADEYASSLQCSDQRLLLLPVRSVKGTFAWVTSPYILRRLKRDVLAASPSATVPPAVPRAEMITRQDGEIAQCAASQPDQLKVPVGGNQHAVVLEDLDLNPDTETAAATAWAEWIADRVFPARNGAPNEWKAELLKRFCVVPDDVLSFLLGTATEVTARIKLDDQVKTVQKGQLWYEETLPTETVLYGLVTATETRDKLQQVRSTIANTFTVVAGLASKVLQFGGKATAGRGLCQLQISAE